MKSARKTLNVVAQNRLYTDFEKLKVLGSGHFGQVYRGTNIHDKMDYAIKVMEINSDNKNKFEVYANASLAISDDVNVLKHIVRYFSSW
jgi:serine/threonine protein kinase